KEKDSFEGNSNINKELVESVEKKKSKPLFEVNVRIVASAKDNKRAQSIFEGISSGFSQFSSPQLNGLEAKNISSSGELIHKFSFREFSSSNAMVLNSEEVASFFHFPTPFMDIPQIKSLKARQLSPPPELPEKGLLLGENIYKGEREEVRIKEKDRRRHIYMIGQTGTGKSNLMTDMLHQDIKNGKGVGVIDPHGDLVEDVLGLIPEDRFDDVILFDPSDINNPLGLNMLEFDQSRPEQKTFIVNEMVEIFDKLYDLQKTGGPMFEQYMRNALLLLMEDFKNEPATLMEVPRVFTDKEFRQRKLKRISNPTVVNFWKKQAEEAGGEASLENVTPYITSKFNNFTANEYMRVIVGQEESSFDFRDVMDKGKIFLVNLSKGKIGDLNANLLGMIVVGKILLAALSRVDMPQSKRRDFNLFIDEFQNFTTESISTILSEARKYRLSLVMAHQFVDQLEDDIESAVFGNVGSTISFRVGAPSAEKIINQFEPDLDENDLVNIDNYHAYVKLLVNGETVDPFNMKTFEAETPDYSRAEKLKDYVRDKKGMAREEVEKEIQRRMNN
ncbi:MAG: type IV secretory system conjugative DNA transfer family protein, partial [Candidatus Magasanikbacteria bacterium]